MPLLSVDDLSVTFGGVRAVDRVSLSLDEGRLAGLIGPNGAGKTTFLDGCTGFVPAAGQVRLADTRLDLLPAYRRARAGLLRTFQSLDLYDDLTVAENVATGLDAVAGARRGPWLALRRLATADDEVTRVVDLLGIGGIIGRFPGELSHGQRALVALARTLAGRPRVLLLDEPAAGLDSRESSQLGRRLRRIRDAGTAILLVEHDMGLVLGHCDVVHVLDGGRLIASGTPAEIRANPAVLAAYLGVDDADPPAAETPTADPLVAALETRPG